MYRGDKQCRVENVRQNVMCMMHILLQSKHRPIDLDIQ